MEYLYDVRMNAWFSPSYLYQVWLWFDFQKGIMHFFNRFYASVISASWLRWVITDITLHITLVDYIKKCETRVILMLWADSTIKWTSSFYWSECNLRKIRFFEIVITFFVVFKVAWNQRPTLTTLRTKFSKPDFLSLCHYMCWYELFFILTFMAKWFCSSEEEVVFWRIVSHSSEYDKKYYLKK